MKLGCNTIHPTERLKDSSSSDFPLSTSDFLWGDRRGDSVSEANHKPKALVNEVNISELEKALTEYDTTTFSVHHAPQTEEKEITSLRRN